MADFQLVSDFIPKGDQPEAIRSLVEGLRAGRRHQTLLGVTGSGKTFTIAQVIEQIGKPVLVISHNKTLAAQLYGEFKGFFPNNAVEYFISYYDYYQPEAYIPTTDTYIEKDTSINDEIDRLRLKATSSLMQREDVLIVASVSCIFGLGSPADFREMLLFLERGARIDRRALLSKLIEIHYTRNDVDFHRGTFRVRGDVVEIFPAYEEYAVRVEFWGDEITGLSFVRPLTGEVTGEPMKTAIYPAKHFVTTYPKLEAAIDVIRGEMEERLAFFRSRGQLLEAQRLETRTLYDIEMLQEVGYCTGIENYSRHLAGRKPGERPDCLIDYFPEDFLLIIDESHATIPQIRAMYNGDRARKQTLVDFGFRLPSALDNRPLTFEEFERVTGNTLFISATPAEYELEKSGGIVVEQIIRPTGLMDPEVVVRPTAGQIDDLVAEIRKRTAAGERVLVTTLTKRMAEDLSDYLSEIDVKVRYLHSEIDALDRVDILRGLRLAEFDVLVGVNLLREGLDLPEVSLVVILDADKEGFLRSGRSLMQTAGRAARHLNGTVILYADKSTDAIGHLVRETRRRRALQEAYNIEHGITPESVYKTIDQIIATTAVADSRQAAFVTEQVPDGMSPIEKEEFIEHMTREMKDAAGRLQFERAAELRDEIERILNPKPGKKRPVIPARRK
ncbi:MAG TPA: excinuclease ABC subunit UvrB [bacterium]|nr:excinuclease ABC subunit UvrB [bacterium]